MILRGLENLGNTCYLNSSLQLLSSSTHFIKCLCSCLYEIERSSGDSLRNACSFTIAIADVIEGITNKPSILTFNIHSFYNNFTEKASFFNDTDQHDALEALQSIMEIMDKEIAIINDIRQRKWIINSTLQHIIDSNNNSNDSYIPISLPTAGLISNVIICSRCGSRRKISNTPFFSLSIPLSETPWWRLDPDCRQKFSSLFASLNIGYACDNPVHTTVHDCLREYTAADTIEDVICKGCGLLDALTSSENSAAESYDLHTEQLRNELHKSLHRVRSSHDMDADFRSEVNKNSITEVKEGKGTIKKYELIGRPPHSLILHLQRKTAKFNPSMAKKNQFVEFPLQIDIREFCLFSQSIPSCHANSIPIISSNQLLHKSHIISQRNNSLVNGSVSNSTSITSQLREEAKEQRSRSGSVISTSFSCSDVYEIADTNEISFSDGENEDHQIIIPKPTSISSFQDSLPYNPYLNTDSLRGGGKPLIYDLVGIIQHIGSGFGGHYICYRRIKNENEDKWYLMNDQLVIETPWEEVKKKEA